MKWVEWFGTWLGFQPFTENKADKSLFVSGSDLFVSKEFFLCLVHSMRGCPTRSGSGPFGSLSRPSTCLGSGELLLMCILALLGPSSASLYSGSDSIVSGSESGTQNVPHRDSVVSGSKSGAQNVPCWVRAVVQVSLVMSAVIQRFIGFW